MPMKNMAPMMAKVELEPADGPGRFRVETFLGMKGDWTLETTVTNVEQAGSARPQSVVCRIVFAPHTYSLTLSNKSMKKLLFSLIAVGFLATSCATDTATDTAAVPDAAAETTEDMPMEEHGKGMESSSEGDYEFEIVSPETAVPTGDAEVVVAIKDAATGEPVDD